jgi:hypothetical protein
MSEDRVDTEDPAGAEDAHEDYVAPTLTDLGSFEELTQFNVGNLPDGEGSS